MNNQRRNFLKGALVASAMVA
nr:twin-arginine translocation signal domain-containing protein [Paludibacteraceae bacterium]